MFYELNIILLYVQLKKTLTSRDSPKVGSGPTTTERMHVGVLPNGYNL